MGLTPVYSSGFDVPEEGKCLFSVETMEFRDDSEKGLTCAVRNTIVESEVPENVGMTVFDNFPLYRDFGIQRLLGFLIKATKMPETLTPEMAKALGVSTDGTGYPPDFFTSKKVQNSVEKKAVGSTFGGMIRHTQGQKGKFANIRDYYTKEEFKDLAKKGKGSSKSSSGTPNLPVEEVGETGASGW